jgi:hypothetical protein
MLVFIIDTFDSIYDEFAKEKEKVKLTERVPTEFPVANRIKSVLTNQEKTRKPVSTLKFISRNTGYFPKLFKSKRCTVEQTHTVVDISLGLVYDVMEILKDYLIDNKTIGIARDYMYIKLTIASCDRIIRILHRGVGPDYMEYHSYFCRISGRMINAVRDLLESNKDLSEQYNTVIELLTNKLCYISDHVRYSLFDI